MRVSTYFAPTLPEAMGKVREELGPKAIVLSWRNVRGGIEISASVQAEERETPSAPAPHKTINPSKPQGQHAPIQRGLGALVGRPSQSMPALAQPSTPVQAQMATQPVTSPLLPFLRRAGLCEQEAIHFATSTATDLRRALSESLQNGLKFRPIDAIPALPILLVGPAGAGKSTCAAKLAARTLAGGHEVMLISADGERCGGGEQLEALAKRLGTGFAIATTLRDLNHQIAQARQRGMVVYVDGAAASPAQPADMRATHRLIDESRLEPVLCLPADLRPDDMADLCAAYRYIGVIRAILTRLDLTTRRASGLYALQTALIELAQVSATPYISGGVAMASAARLTDLLLEPFEDALETDNKGWAA